MFSYQLKSPHTPSPVGLGSTGLPPALCQRSTEPFWVTPGNAESPRRAVVQPERAHTQLQGTRMPYGMSWCHPGASGCGMPMGGGCG